MSEKRKWIIERETPTVTKDGDKHLLLMKSTIDEAALKRAAAEDAAIREALIRFGWTPPSDLHRLERAVLAACVKWACGGMYEDDRFKLIDAAFAYRTALAGEAKAGDDECAKGNHAWRGPLLGWWRCVLCGEKTGDAGHPSKTKLAALEAENARLAHERDAWRSSSTMLAAERDEFQRRVLEAEKEVQRAYDTGLDNGLRGGQDERDELAAKVEEMEARGCPVCAARYGRLCGKGSASFDSTVTCHRFAGHEGPCEFSTTRYTILPAIRAAAKE